MRWVLVIALMALAGCTSLPEHPDDPIRFQCYNEATGMWEWCPTELEEMDCHEPSSEKEL